MNLRIIKAVYKTHNIQFKTPLSVEEITERLNFYIDCEKSIGSYLFGPGKKYSGSIRKHGFKFKKFKLREDVSPVVIGKIRQEDNMVVVDVNISNSGAFIYSLFLAVFVFITLDFVWCFISIILSQHTVVPQLLVLVVFCLVWGGMLYFIADKYNCTLEDMIIDLEYILQVPGRRS